MSIYDAYQCGVLRTYLLHKRKHVEPFITSRCQFFLKEKLLYPGVQ